MSVNETIYNPPKLGPTTAVTSLDGMTGDITLVPGAHISIVDGPGTITISATGELSQVLPNGDIFVGNASNVATAVAMSGDATIVNTGAVTLATVNSNVGSFTNASVTLNAKGLVTAASSGTALSFIDSIVNTAGTVTLVNDAPSPGNSVYYGTDSGGAKGYYGLPAPVAPASPDGTIQINASGSFGTVGGMVVDQTGNTRGARTLDIQSKRTASTQVTASDESFAYGEQNRVGTGSSDASFSSAFGYQNSILGTMSTSVGATQNIGTGADNCTSLGTLNTIGDRSLNSTVVGLLNTINTLVSQSTLVGSFNNTSSGVTTLVGTSNSAVLSPNSTLVGAGCNATNINSGLLLGLSINAGASLVSPVTATFMGSFLTIPSPTKSMYFGLNALYFQSSSNLFNYSNSISEYSCLVVGGLSQAAFGHNLVPIQTGEVSTGYVSSAIGQGQAGLAQISLEYNATAQELQTGGAVIAQRIKILPGFTYLMNINILQTENDLTVNTWCLQAKAQNTGGVVAGIGNVRIFGDAGITTATWGANGVGGTAFSDPVGEDTGVKLLFDTSNATNELVIHVQSAPAGTLFYASVDIVKTGIAMSGSSSSS